MEHPADFKRISERTGIADNEKILKLHKYANLILSENKKFNLTGHKTLSDIIEILIIGSLEPVKTLNVPRGTLFADIGTGAGIPGIPLSIKNEESSGILFDSNQKKIRFINKIAKELEILNIQGVDIRIEDACRSDIYREKFDFVFSRAMSDLYTMAELSSPLLKVGGSLFLYIKKSQIKMNESLREHLIDIGLTGDVIPAPEDTSRGYITEGILLVKIKETGSKYPRRMPVIKRMAMKYN